MSFELQQYIEPLAPDELKFLTDKEQKDRKQYFRVFDLLMLLSFIIPFAGAWYQAYDGAPNAFSPFRYFFSVGVLLSLSTFSTYVTYRVNLRKIQLDIRDSTKTVETNRITRKVYVGTKKACYFYIDSKITMSIEVSMNDFERLAEGDEVSIEYATHSGLYLGYF